MITVTHTTNEGYYITKSGTKVEVESQPYICIISDKDIVELKVPGGCQTLYCHDNKLRKLILNEGVKFVSCFRNELTDLTFKYTKHMLFIESK